MREKIVHRQLAQMFSIPPEVFTLCLLNANWNEVRSTQACKQTFLRYTDGEFEQIKMHIVNMSDSNSTYQQPIVQEKNAFDMLVESLELDFRTINGLKAIGRIQDVVPEAMEKLVGELSKIETLMFKLETEVKNMEALVEEKNREEDELLNNDN